MGTRSRSPWAQGPMTPSKWRDCRPSPNQYLGQRGRECQSLGWERNQVRLGVSGAEEAAYFSRRNFWQSQLSNKANRFSLVAGTMVTHGSTDTASCDDMWAQRSDTDFHTWPRTVHELTQTSAKPPQCVRLWTTLPSGILLFSFVKWG